MKDENNLPVSREERALMLLDDKQTGIGKWWREARLFSLLSPMQEIVSKRRNGIADDMQERVGLVHLSGETRTLAKAHAKAKLVEATRIISAVAFNTILSSGLILSQMISEAPTGIFADQILCCLFIFIFVVMLPITWITIVAVFPLQKYNIMLTAAKEGWHVQLVQACRMLAAHGVTLPVDISVLVPSLEVGNPSLTVLRQLGDADTAAMFTFTDAMTAEAARALKAKKRLQVPPPLLLAGETGELLGRVSLTLDVDTEDYSTPRVI